MKVFISWSGTRSLAIARALHDWLPRVIQAIQPWMSESDIEKGTRWEQVISRELADSKFGIVCLTPENLGSRWINFEAGAIAKAVEKNYVCTYLFNLRPADIEGPLAQFNHTKAERNDTRRLIHTLNRALESNALREPIVDEAFAMYWERLHSIFADLPADEAAESPRQTDDMIREILETVRTQATHSSLSSLMSKTTPRLLSTLDWTPEDARLLSEYYKIIKQRSIRRPADDPLVDFVDRLGRDQGFARTIVDGLKTMNPQQLETLLSEAPTDENNNS
ncbi:MAG TPA: toll/interleukin-1 receptor domain-containing protein [Pyrinomonadaceae bacterium]